MKRNKTSKRKLVSKKPSALTEFERLEIGEYTKEERDRLFGLAIGNMVMDGLISPKEYREYLSNIRKWLAEELDS